MVLALPSLGQTPLNAIPLHPQAPTVGKAGSVSLPPRAPLPHTDNTALLASRLFPQG